MRIIVIAAIAALFGLSSAKAQPPVSNPSGLISFNANALQALVQEAGWTARIEQNNGRPAIIATVEGRTLVLNPTACGTNGQCGGLLTFAVLPDQASLETVNQFNVRYNPIRATIRGGRVVLDRYTIADFGAARGSVVVDLAVHASMINEWWKFRGQGGQGGLSNAISFSPLIDPQETHNKQVSILQDVPLSLSLFEKLAEKNIALPTVAAE